jgi:hypothetical protein
MNLYEVNKFINLTKQSNYDKFKSIIVSGGEPLLWRNLEEGVKALRESNLAEAIHVFSNGINTEKVTPKVIDNIHVLRVSRYKENAIALNDLAKRYGSKIVIVDRMVHTPIPDKFYDNVLPAKCHCEGYALCDGVMYACPMIPAVAKEMKIPLMDLPLTYCKLQVNWAEVLNKFTRENHKLCKACIGNLKVRRLKGTE